MEERAQHRGGLGRSAAGLAGLGLLLLAMVGGCPGSLDDPGRFGGSGGSGACPDIPNDVFLARCANAGCHNAADQAGSLNLEPSGLESRIVDVPATGCGGMLADTADPAASLLYTKCLETNDCASRMPLTGVGLSDRELECLLEYLGTL